MREVQRQPRDMATNEQTARVYVGAVDGALCRLEGGCCAGIETFNGGRWKERGAGEETAHYLDLGLTYDFEMDKEPEEVWEFLEDKGRLEDGADGVEDSR